jgi:hypothetical protein
VRSPRRHLLTIVKSAIARVTTATAAAVLFASVV